MTATKTSLGLYGIEAGYGNLTVLRDLNLFLKKGEFVTILGENGAGKTTLFHVILHLVQAVRGRICVLDRDVTKIHQHQWLRSQIGYVPQRYESGRFPISVFDAVLLGRWGTSFAYLKKPSLEDRQLTEEILEKVGLISLAQQDCRRLSGGQSQRLNLARALIRKPRILLLDEPATFLDKEAQEMLDDILRNLRQELSLSILMISHNQHHAQSLSDRLLLLQDGCLIEIWRAAT
ncbi:MAG: ATP-binding cassette domain-containing protein [Bacillota bacterium]|nr:ATP-binding cassette domain-containing protein [Bacillota bacterium]